jgi:hypothetical protein
MRTEFLGGPIDILFLTETVDPADQFMTSRRRRQHAALTPRNKPTSGDAGHLNVLLVMN